MSRLELAGLAKRYGAVAAVDGVDLDVPAGSRTAILGPSGCGKSTLLRLVAGFEAPDAGTVRLGGEAIAEGPSAVPAHRRRVGIVMQEGALFPHLTVAGNVGFALAGGRRERRARVEGLMDLVGLPASMLDRRPDQISGGQQQRVALARALACEPRLMLLDEPFSALDAGLRSTTRDAVAALLTARSITTVLVTHDQGEALGFADQVAVMREGRIRRVGSPRDVYLRPRDAAVATFLGEAVIVDADAEGGVALSPLGRLQVDDVSRRGPVRVMLRPEQLEIAGAEDGGVPGRVVASAFQGHTATLRVRLDAVPDGAPVVVQVAGFKAREVGDMIGVVTRGVAHVLDG